MKEERNAEEASQSTVEVIVRRLFKIDSRDTTIMREVHCGFLHFISAAFVLSVNPAILSTHSKYSASSAAAATALCTGFSCIMCGLLCNLPFILAPTTSTSLYYALYLENENLSIEEGNLAIFLLSVVFSICGVRALTLLISGSIPFVIKVGVCLGVGLLIALEALCEIGLVQVTML
jgi:AGZA family xanthine/uracil permease-like MFS transporter